MRYEVIVNGVSYLVEVKALRAGKQTRFYSPCIRVLLAHRPYSAPSSPPKSEPQGGANTVESPMPGKIISVAVKEGGSGERPTSPYP